jgi:hypothetical protein
MVGKSVGEEKQGGASEAAESRAVSERMLMDTAGAVHPLSARELAKRLSLP